MNAFAIILLGSLATPGPMTAQGTTADAYDGCALISVADVEAIIGEPLRGRPRVVRRTIMTLENYGCSYRSQNFNVEVRLETGRDRDGLEMYLKALGATVKQTTASTLRPVTGIGERAWWGPVNATNGMFHVVRGTDVVWVQFYGQGPGAGSLEKTRAIAEKVYAQYQRVRKK